MMIRTLITAAIAAAGLASTLAAQSVTLDFSALAEKAKSKVEITLDGAMLASLGGQASLERLKGVKSISVHAYEFSKEGEYSAAALEPVRRQYASAPGWSKLLSAHEEKETADVFVHQQDGKLLGLVVIAAEPKSVAIIQAEGAIELAQMQEVVKSAIQFDLAALEKKAGPKVEEKAGQE